MASDSEDKKSKEEAQGGFVPLREKSIPEEEENPGADAGATPEKIVEYAQPIGSSGSVDVAAEDLKDAVRKREEAEAKLTADAAALAAAKGRKDPEAELQKLKEALKISQNTFNEAYALEEAAVQRKAASDAALAAAEAQRKEETRTKLVPISSDINALLKKNGIAAEKILAEVHDGSDTNPGVQIRVSLMSLDNGESETRLKLLNETLKEQGINSVIQYKGVFPLLIIKNNDKLSTIATPEFEAKFKNNLQRALKNEEPLARTLRLENEAETFLSIAIDSRLRANEAPSDTKLKAEADSDTAKAKAAHEAYLLALRSEADAAIASGIKEDLVEKSFDAHRVAAEQRIRLVEEAKPEELKAVADAAAAVKAETDAAAVRALAAQEAKRAAAEKPAEAKAAEKKLQEEAKAKLEPINAALEKVLENSGVENSDISTRVSLGTKKDPGVQIRVALNSMESKTKFNALKDTLDKQGLSIDTIEFGGEPCLIIKYENNDYNKLLTITTPDFEEKFRSNLKQALEMAKEKPLEPKPETKTAAEHGASGQEEPTPPAGDEVFISLGSFIPPDPDLEANAKAELDANATKVLQEQLDTASKALNALLNSESAALADEDPNNPGIYVYLDAIGIDSLNALKKTLQDESVDAQVMSDPHEGAEDQQCLFIEASGDALARISAPEFQDKFEKNLVALVVMEKPAVGDLTGTGKSVTSAADNAESKIDIVKLDLTAATPDLSTSQLGSVQADKMSDLAANARKAQAHADELAKAAGQPVVEVEEMKVAKAAHEVNVVRVKALFEDAKRQHDQANADSEEAKKFKENNLNVITTAATAQASVETKFTEAKEAIENIKGAGNNDEARAVNKTADAAVELAGKEIKKASADAQEAVNVAQKMVDAAKKANEASLKALENMAIAASEVSAALEHAKDLKIDPSELEGLKIPEQLAGAQDLVESAKKDLEMCGKILTNAQERASELGEMVKKLSDLETAGHLTTAKKYAENEVSERQALYDKALEERDEADKKVAVNKRLFKDAKPESTFEAETLMMKAEAVAAAAEVKLNLKDYHLKQAKRSLCGAEGAMEAHGASTLAEKKIIEERVQREIVVHNQAVDDAWGKHSVSEKHAFDLQDKVNKRPSTDPVVKARSDFAKYKAEFALALKKLNSDYDEAIGLVKTAIENKEDHEAVAQKASDNFKPAANEAYRLAEAAAKAAEAVFKATGTKEARDDATDAREVANRAEEEAESVAKPGFVQQLIKRAENPPKRMSSSFADDDDEDDPMFSASADPDLAGRARRLAGSLAGLKATTGPLDGDNTLLIDDSALQGPTTEMGDKNKANHSIRGMAQFFREAIKDHTKEYGQDLGFEVSVGLFSRKSFTVKDKEGKELLVVSKNKSDNSISYKFPHGDEIGFGMADVVLRASQKAQAQQVLTLHSTNIQHIEEILKAASTPPNDKNIKIKLDAETEKFLKDYSDQNALREFTQFRIKADALTGKQSAPTPKMVEDATKAVKAAEAADTKAKEDHAAAEIVVNKARDDFAKITVTTPVAEKTAAETAKVTAEAAEKAALAQKVEAAKALQEAIVKQKTLTKGTADATKGKMIEEKAIAAATAAAKQLKENNAAAKPSKAAPPPHV